MRPAINSIAAAALLACLAACTQSVTNQLQPTAPGNPAPTITAGSIIIPPSNSTTPVISPDSIRPDTNVPDATLEVVRLDVYQITVPQGAVSESDAFWKYVEEPVVDVDTNDRLYENGVRVGEASMGDWPHFKTILDKAGAQQQHSSLMAHNAQSQELFATPPMHEQRIFYFDRHGLSGKVFDDCRDLFTMSYQPAPRDPGCVRIGLCPVVQALRYHYTYNALNGEEGAQFTQAEHLYDLNLTVDLPAGRFLVVAPSPDAKSPDSIGARFLTEDDATSRLERVLILVANTPATLQSLGTVPPPAP